MAGRTSRYHVVPHDSMDSDRDQESAHEYLLPSPNLSNNPFKFSIPYPRSTSISLASLLRFISFALGLSAFIVLVVRGGHNMIAVDVFLMMTVVFNALKLLWSLLTWQNFLRVKVLVRGVDLSSSGSSNRGRLTKMPTFSNYVDILLAICLLIATPACYSKKPWWKGNDALVAVILSYIVLGFHVVLALPMLDQVRFTVQLGQAEEPKLGSYMAYRPDLKPVVHNEPTSIPEPEPVLEPQSQDEQPTQVAVDLV